MEELHIFVLCKKFRVSILEILCKFLLSHKDKYYYHTRIPNTLTASKVFLFVILSVVLLSSLSVSAFAAAAITFTTTSGPSGTSISSISGSGWGNSKLITIWFDTNNDSLVTAGEPSTTATTGTGGTAGLFSGASLTAPTALNGIYNIRATQSSPSVSASATFTVTNTVPTAGSLVSPSDASLLNAKPLLSWNAATAGSLALSATPYVVKIDDNSDFSSPLVTSFGQSSLSYDTTSASLVSGTTYYWRITVSDIAGNTANSASRSFTFDNTNPTAAITYSTPGPYKSGDTVTITATFNEPVKDSPLPQLSISGANTLAAVDMAKTSTTVYTYLRTIDAGDGTATVAMATAQDTAGNVITAAPTSGATHTIDNTNPTAAITYSTPGPY